MRTEHKKHQAIMLPTENKSNLILNESLNILGDNNYFNEVAVQSNSYINYYNLYIVSDEEIKEGDWCIDIIGVPLGAKPKIRKATKDFAKDSLNTNDAKKIIATTDTSLKTEPFMGFEENTGKDITNYLPQIPQDFIKYYIKEYNKGNIITKANVEYYKTIVDKNTNSEIHHFGYEFDDAVESGHIIPIEKYQLRTTTDNTISILPVKTSWNREEVITKCQEAVHYYIETGHFPKYEWAKENL